MAINFPISLDSLTNPAPTDDVSIVSHSAQHSDVNDAIEAIEAKLGINGSLVTTSIDYLLKNAASVDPGHTHSAAAIGAGFVKVDGSTPLTASWAAGAFNITANRFISTVATGTSPLGVTSTTVVLNLNAEFLNGDIVGTIGKRIPLLNTNNTWSGVQNFSTAPTFTNATVAFSVTSNAVIANLNASLLSGNAIGTSGAAIGLLNANNTHSGNNTFSGSNIQSANSFTFNNDIKLQFGTSAVAGIYYDSTAVALVIDPKISGSAYVAIGAPSSGGGTADLVCNKLGLLGSAISGTAVVNLIATGAARQALNFNLTFTGSGTSGASVIGTRTDQGSASSMLYNAFLAQETLATLSHTTYTASAFKAQMGLSASLVFTTGTYTVKGFESSIADFGVGNASTSGGTFRRTAVFINTITAIAGTPTADFITGIYNAEAHDMIADKAISFDGSATAHGDSTIMYNSGSTRMELDVDGTDAIYYATGGINLLLDVTMADAKNIILNGTTGTKIGTATTQKLSFYNKTPIVQPTDGATLTNNVTSGGTTDQIDNWTSLTVYATDAAAIRNAIYQLSRKLKIVVDNQRALGLAS